MRGGTRKRGTTWTWHLGVVDPATGRWRQLTKGGFRTRREAQAALNEAKTALRSGTFVEPSRLTLGAFLTDQWLPTVRAAIRPTTWTTYRIYAEAQVLPALGNVPLQTLTAAHLNRLYADLAEHGRGGTAAAGSSPRASAMSTCCCTRRSAMRCAGAWSPATSPTPPTRRGCPTRNAAPGQPRSSAPSWRPQARTAWPRCGCCSPPPGCAAASCSACPGEPSTWRPRPAGSPSSRRSWSWTSSRSSCPRPRPPPATASSPSTRSPRPPSRPIGSASLGSAWPGGQPGPTPAWSSPARTAGSCTPSTSPSASPAWCGTPAWRRSPCTASVTATPPRRWPPASPSRLSPSGSATPAPRSPPTSTSMCCRRWTSAPPTPSPA
jgi:hypothetical protein